MSRFTPFFTPVLRGRRCVYISGPMTGLLGDNAGSFNRAAHGLRKKGYSVCNPHETSEMLGEMSHEEYLRFDFERILEADFLAVLDGWEDSVGALVEIHMATRMGLMCWLWNSWSKAVAITSDEVVKAIGEKFYKDSTQRTHFAPIAGGKL